MEFDKNLYMFSKILTRLWYGFFSLIGSTIPLLPEFRISSLAMFCGSTAGFVSDLVRNLKTGFLMTQHNVLSDD